MLLFFGMRDENPNFDRLNPANKKRAGFSAAKSLMIDDIAVKIPSQYNMLKAAQSPFVYSGDKIYDTILGDSISVSLPSLDLSDSNINNLIVASNNGVVSAMVFNGCKNFDDNIACQFCTAGKAKSKVVIDPQLIVAELKTLNRFNFSVNTISLNTGQMLTGGEFEAILNCANAIKNYDSNIKIAAEIWPYSVPKDLSVAKEKIDVFMINLELANDYALKKLCPAKPDKQEYFEVFNRLNKSGFEVTSVIQTNYYLQDEPIGEVISTIKQMLYLGVTPELLISRAVRNSNITDGFFDVKTTLEQNLVRYFLWLNRIEQLIDSSVAKSISIKSKEVNAGCVKCGMCNLNPDIK